ncbi:MAG TPA: site-specific DNA-methyltransferase [Pirellulales bacterium]|nr:site-specific DNA-methyltransferase [Pirellulales bacterium]
MLFYYGGAVDWSPVPVVLSSGTMKQRRKPWMQRLDDRLDRAGRDCDFGPWRALRHRVSALEQWIETLPPLDAEQQQVLADWLEWLPGPPDHVHCPRPLARYAFRLESGARIRFELSAIDHPELVAAAGNTLEVRIPRCWKSASLRRTAGDFAVAILATLEQAGHPSLPVACLQHHLTRFLGWHRQPVPIYNRAPPRWRAELDRLVVQHWCRGSPQATLVSEAGRRIAAALGEHRQRFAELWQRVPRVVERCWCVTIDRLPSALHGEICRSESQVRQWRERLAIDDPITPAFLRTHPHLVVDTRHFDSAFCRRVSKALGSQVRADGMLICGENSAALRWLLAQSIDPVRCVFIDPPYNTGSAVWSYGDRFDHATWVAMMRDRLALARELMRDDAAIFVTLDDHEQARLRLLLDELFGEQNFLATIIWEKVHTRKNSARHFSVSHDYLPVFAKNRERWRRNLLPRDDTSAYANPDDDPRGAWKLDPVYANKPYAADYTITKPNGVRLAPPPGRYWRFSRENFARKVAAGEVVWGDGHAWPMVKRYLADVQQGLVPTTLFSRTLAGDNALANAELVAMFGAARQVTYPKPSLLVRRVLQIATDAHAGDTVLDFFAGSGATVQAVIDQNRADGGNRRWIAIEASDCFDTLLVPRTIKALYAEQWKRGKPASAHGVSAAYEIVRLESFEDALAADA